MEMKFLEVAAGAGAGGRVPRLEDLLTADLITALTEQLDTCKWPPANGRSDLKALAQLHPSAPDHEQCLTQEVQDLLSAVACLPSILHSSLCQALFALERYGDCPGLANPAVPLAVFHPSTTVTLCLEEWESSVLLALQHYPCDSSTSSDCDAKDEPEEQVTTTKNETTTLKRGTPVRPAPVSLDHVRQEDVETKRERVPAAPHLTHIPSQVSTAWRNNGLRESIGRSLCTHVLLTLSKRCVALTDVNLSHNPHVVDDDVLCQLVAHCPQLRKVSVHSCRMTDVGLHALFGLHSLTRLDIQSCKRVKWQWQEPTVTESKGVQLPVPVPVSAPVPVPVPVSSLKHLNCSGCPRLSRGGSLHHLFMHPCRPAVRLCAQLTSLNLSACALSSVPESLSTLGELRDLNLAVNELESCPPAKSLSCLQHLTALDLSGNRLTALPAVLGMLPRLCLLKARANRISRVDSALSQCSQLHTLNLSYNEMSVVPALAYDMLKQLTLLDLTYNRIADLNSHAVQQLLTGLQRQATVRVSHQQR